MKPTTKILARAPRGPIVVAPEKWHTVDTSITGLDAEISPIVQVLSEAERRNLLRVGPAKEPFINDCLALIQAHPSLVPASLPTADAIRDWATRHEMQARRWLVSTILAKFDDTIAGLESDCYATALEAFQVMARGGARAGVEPELAELRQHFSRYGARKAAPDDGTSAPNANGAGAPGNVMSLPGTPGSGTSPHAIAA